MSREVTVFTFPAAGLNVTEPTSTGIGGDMFLLYYDAATGRISAMNGSGRAPGKCTLGLIRAELGLRDGEAGKVPMSSVHAVTVPGAAAGWVDTLEKFGSGKVTPEEVLTPAIVLAENGFPVSELTGYYVGLLTFAILFFSSDMGGGSGTEGRPASATPRPTSPRCSRKIPLPRTVCALRVPVRS